VFSLTYKPKVVATEEVILTVIITVLHTICFSKVRVWTSIFFNATLVSSMFTLVPDDFEIQKRTGQDGTGPVGFI